jgi:hypothetical protein
MTQMTERVYSPRREAVVERHDETSAAMMAEGLPNYIYFTSEEDLS